MKKGINYIPLFIVNISMIVGTSILGDWLSLTSWVISLLFLCEVYYLRFLK